MSTFFFNDTAPTEIYTLSLHDVLPISCRARARENPSPRAPERTAETGSSASPRSCRDRKSTRLNSSHLGISYAVFCLKKKKNTTTQIGYVSASILIMQGVVHIVMRDTT